MKITLFFLSALLAITTQQFHHPMGLSWFSTPYNYPQFYYNNLQDNNPFIRHFRPSRPISSHQYDEMFNQGLLTDSKAVEEDDNNPYTDIQSRVKGFKSPAFQDKQDPRFFYFGSASSYTNLFFRTATFTLTSTVNVTKVQVCAPSTAFTLGATTCRRKRRDINMDWMDEPGYDQFYIAATETQKVESTLLPEMESIQEENHHIPNNHHGLISSQKEDNVKEIQFQNKKQKRFVFNQFVASTTITSYTFVTTTVTKTANLAASASALCRPEGFINC